ncbi:hypothetical protein J31TS4_09490 [Paenibacillus sp. J31TS4]|uniref:cytochrome-c oxidase n=1 Tax=Paenibacillus sp. J31TS4 TaxID=2807195 RepID=UPI001B2E09A3|nr:cytochrome-c oxidase [Paenibacillus sp. J31TS4]GIP37669.1 hypothetical protein J31TS4_09490 [Paenibacillus sp. J31TS4]
MGNQMIKLSALYFSIGVLLGIGMGISHDFALTSAHAHINLLGWLSLGVTGILYRLYPSLAASSLARVHVWLHNIGLPIMIAGIVAAVLGEAALGATLASVGGILVVLGVLAFTWNVWTRLK